MSQATCQQPDTDYASERRSRWLFRLQICLLLSIIAHILFLYYMKDVVIEFLNPSITRLDSEQTDAIPMPVREQKVMPGYADTRLDSPQIHDSFEQINPAAPISQPELEAERIDPKLEEMNIQTEHEFQTPETPELADVSNMKPVDVQEFDSPVEETKPEISQTVNQVINGNNVPESLPLPELEIELPQSQPIKSPQRGNLGVLDSSDIPDSTPIVLRSDIKDRIVPTTPEVTVDSVMPPLETLVLQDMTDMPLDHTENSPIPVRRPIPTGKPMDIGKVKAPTVTIASSRTTSSGQTTRPANSGVRGLPKSHFDSASAYNEQVATDIARSTMRDGPIRADSIDIPPSRPSIDPTVGISSIGNLSSSPDDYASISTPIPVRRQANPAAAYKLRDPSLRPEAITRFGGDPQLNQSIENGLNFLSKTQWSDGRWCFHVQPDAFTYRVPREAHQNGSIQCDTAATALGLLSMMGAGYSHMDGAYQQEVQKGLNYLLSHQQKRPPVGKDGRLGIPGALYNTNTDTDNNSLSYAHAMATVALCEAYGLTRDRKLLEPARAAVKYIIATQNPKFGGWRYENADNLGRPYAESDTSSSGWQIMALKSAVQAEILPAEVVNPSLQKAQRWLDMARKSDGRYAYNPFNGSASEYGNWKRTTPTMTAEAAFMQWCINPAGADLKPSIEYILDNAPGDSEIDGYKRDVYYWYYASAIMFAQQGDAWNQWQGKVMPIIKDSQVSADSPLGGSWDVNNPSLDKWSHLGGRHYLTCMNLMILEIYTRHLSFYK